MQGIQGPTGIAGPYGYQGIGWLGPTGSPGIQGIGQPGYESVTGPTGISGLAGAGQPLSGQIVSISAYSATGYTGTMGVTGTVGMLPTTVWSNAIPASAVGKSGVLSVYFDMKLNYPIVSCGFDYGLYIDDVPLAQGPSPLQHYAQTVTSTNLVGSNGTSLGSIAPTALYPLSLPVTISPTAASLQLKLANTTNPINSLTVLSSGITAMTTTGSNAYTSPAGTSGIMVYVWGCGGTSFGSNAGGPGGFGFGYYPCAPGTVFTGIVGALGNQTFAYGYGGYGVSGTGSAGSGGGFSALFVGNSPTQSANVIVMLSGGGGGCLQNAAGSSFTFNGGNGGGLIGASSINTATGATQVNGYGSGATQSTPGNNNAGQWYGGAYNNGQGGAGGGGVWGGGAGYYNAAGGGGSGFVGTGISNAYVPTPSTLTTLIPAGLSASNIMAVGSNFMSGFGYSPTTYAHGNGGTGIIIIVPVVSTGAPIMGVDARFSTT